MSLVGSLTMYSSSATLAYPSTSPLYSYRKEMICQTVISWVIWLCVCWRQSK